jgi:hypothetical protein
MLRVGRVGAQAARPLHASASAATFASSSKLLDLLARRLRASRRDTFVTRNYRSSLLRWLLHPMRCRAIGVPGATFISLREIRRSALSIPRGDRLLRWPTGLGGPTKRPDKDAARPRDPPNPIRVYVSIERGKKNAAAAAAAAVAAALVVRLFRRMRRYYSYTVGSDAFDHGPASVRPLRGEQTGECWTQVAERPRTASSRVPRDVLYVRYVTSTKSFLILPLRPPSCASLLGKNARPFRESGRVINCPSADRRGGAGVYRHTRICLLAARLKSPRTFLGRIMRDFCRF